MNGFYYFYWIIIEPICFNILLSNFIIRDLISCREIMNLLFKIFLQCNDVPNFTRINGGITRRTNIIKFENQFKSNSNPNNINEKLIDENSTTNIYW